MTSAFVDTSVLIHLFRKHTAAQAWFSAQTEQLAVSTITWLEFMDGVPSSKGQTLSLAILAQFQVIHLTEEDQDWAMQQMTLYRLSAGVHMDDCLIAAVCHRLQMPIYTHNVKDLRKLLPDAMVIRPFIA